jgi:hypothetical protein
VGKCQKELCVPEIVSAPYQALVEQRCIYISKESLVWFYFYFGTRHNSWLLNILHSCSQHGTFKSQWEEAKKGLEI